MEPCGDFSIGGGEAEKSEAPTVTSAYSSGRSPEAADDTPSAVPAEAPAEGRDGHYRLLRRRYISKEALFAEAEARLAGNYDRPDREVVEDAVVYVADADAPTLLDARGGVTPPGSPDAVVELTLASEAFPGLALYARRLTPLSSDVVAIDGTPLGTVADAPARLRHGSRLRLPGFAIVVVDFPPARVVQLDDLSRSAKAFSAAVADVLARADAAFPGRYFTVRDVVRLLLMASPDLGARYAAEDPARPHLRTTPEDGEGPPGTDSAVFDQTRGRLRRTLTTSAGPPSGVEIVREPGATKQGRLLMRWNPTAAPATGTAP